MILLGYFWDGSGYVWETIGILWDTFGLLLENLGYFWGTFLILLIYFVDTLRILWGYFWTNLGRVLVILADLG